MLADFEFVPFTEAHLDGALALSREVSWPHRREDWAMALELSHGVAIVRDGEVLGTALLTPFGENFTTLNMIIVAASLRGLGLGRRLMEQALAICGARECRLVATRDGLPLYEKFGFRATGAIVQHQGVPTDLPIPIGPAPRIATCEDLATLIALDQRAGGMNREMLMRAIFARGDFAIEERDGEIVGFAGLRDFGRGRVVGPVVARDASVARRLILHAAARHPSDFLRLDTDEATGIGPWIAGHGLAHVGGGISMTRPGPRPVEAERTTAATVPDVTTFTLVSQAFG